MAVKTSIILGRFLVLALITLQCFFLASYLAEYDDKSGWYAISILFIPAVMLWWLITHRPDSINVFIFWGLYMWLGLVPSIGIVFGRFGDKITSKGFWNPSTLKVTLCITPLLLLLMFCTKIATNEFTPHSEQVMQYSLKAVINLCDGIELVCVLLDENECSPGISKPYKNTLIAFACLSYLWLPFAMFLEYRATFDGEDEDFRLFVFVSCYLTQAVLETIFLGLRMGLSLRYGVTTSIFIMKNVLMITVLARQMFNVCFGSEDDSSANEQGRQEEEGSLPEPTRPTPTPPLPDNTPAPGSVTMVRPFRNWSVMPIGDSIEPSAPPPPYNPEMME